MGLEFVWTSRQKLEVTSKDCRNSPIVDDKRGNFFCRRPKVSDERIATVGGWGDSGLPSMAAD